MLGNFRKKIYVSNEQRDAYPRRLSLEEQGMFVLGYYHQTRKRYEKESEGGLRYGRSD